MKIVILGAGQVGGTLAATLANEANDITVVDVNEGYLRGLRDRLDIGVVCGHASHPAVLIRAGIEDASASCEAPADLHLQPAPQPSGPPSAPGSG